MHAVPAGSDPRRTPPAARVLRRVAVTLAGGVVVVIGVILMPLPGPGMLIVAAGMAILATEYEWPQRVYRHLRRELADVERQLLGWRRSRRRRRRR
ncbi:hypothetical protein BH20ACT8_BH20ACT8_04700 [soil metagenome]